MNTRYYGNGCHVAGRHSARKKNVRAIMYIANTTANLNINAKFNETTAEIEEILVNFPSIVKFPINLILMSIFYAVS